MSKIFRPGPRPKTPRCQIPFLERLGLVEIPRKQEVEINSGFVLGEDTKVLEKSSKKYTE